MKSDNKTKPIMSLPKEIKTEIEKQISNLKEVLKGHEEFAEEIIKGLHDIVIGKVYYDTFYQIIKSKYDFSGFPYTLKLVHIVNDLAYLVSGEHECIDAELRETDFDHALVNSIEQYITEAFYTDIIGENSES